MYGYRVCTLCLSVAWILGEQYIVGGERVISF